MNKTCLGLLLLLLPAIAPDLAVAQQDRSMPGMSGDKIQPAGNAGLDMMGAWKRWIATWPRRR